MKRAAILTIALLIAFPATAFCAAGAPGVAPGRAVVGLAAYNPDMTGEVEDRFSYYEGYAIAGIGGKVAAFVNYGRLGDTLPEPVTGVMTSLTTRYTDYGLQYSLSPHVGVLAGYRNLNGRQTTAAGTVTDAMHDYVYGLALRYDFGSKVSAYSTYLKNDRVQDLTVGTAYRLSNDMFLGVSYRSVKGAAVGITAARNFGAAEVGIRL